MIFSQLIVAAVWAIVVLFASDTVISLIWLSLVVAGSTATVPILLDLPAQFMSAMARAAGVALVRTFANIGPVISPFLIGWATGVAGTPDTALWIIGGGALLVAIGVVTLLRESLARDPKV